MTHSLLAITPKLAMVLLRVSAMHGRVMGMIVTLAKLRWNLSPMQRTLSPVPLALLGRNLRVLAMQRCLVGAH